MYMDPNTSTDRTRTKVPREYTGKARVLRDAATDAEAALAAAMNDAAGPAGKLFIRPNDLFSMKHNLANAIGASPYTWNKQVRTVKLRQDFIITYETLGAATGFRESWDPDIQQSAGLAVRRVTVIGRKREFFVDTKTVAFVCFHAIARAIERTGLDTVDPYKPLIHATGTPGELVNVPFNGLGSWTGGMREARIRAISREDMTQIDEYEETVFFAQTFLPPR